MTKRYYKITFHGTGGEVIVAKTSEEFVAHWIDQDQDELSSFLYDDSHDIDSPELTAGLGSEIFDAEALLQCSGPSAEYGYYTVTEIQPADPESFNADPYDIGEYSEISDDESQDFDHWVYSREAYSNFSLSDDYLEDLGLLRPVLTWCNVEKGDFGSVFIQVDGEFDPDKFGIGVVETSMGEFVERIWYDGEELDINTDEYSTRGVEICASVGFIYEPWFQTAADADHISEGLEAMEDN